MAENETVRSVSHLPYIVFCGFTYYASPGWTAHCGEFDDIKDAELCAKTECLDKDFDWWQIVDLRISKIIAGEGESHTGLFGAFPANPSGKKTGK